MSAFDPEPWLGTIPDGTSVNVAARAWYRDSTKGAYHCTTALRGQVFLLQGVELLGDRFMTLDAVKTTEHGTVVLTTQAADTQIHSLIDREGAMDVIDICSGYAIMTAGYHLIGCRTRCHVEINAKYAQWLRDRHRPVIEGDIDSTQVKRDLMSYMAKPCILTGGFACQPFSQLGDGRQQMDPRARSFEGMVATCYLFQPVAMILECTKEAMQSTWVQEMLQSFCHAAGYKFQQQVCHLQGLWPAKRTRWWAVITHPGVQMPELKSFPALDFQPSFRHLLPKMAEWSEHQVVELALSADELEAFDSQPGGLGKNAVSPTKPLMTALHAWGSQLQACACGCRAGGFTTQRLEEKGFYGALIPIKGVTNVRGCSIQNMRHVHPDEVAILHMVPPEVLQADHRSLRLDLTALGQMASPAQAFERVFGVPPKRELAEFAARDAMLAPFVHTKESSLFQQAIHVRFGSQYKHVEPAQPQFVASVASHVAPTFRHAMKRKAERNETEPTESQPNTVVSVTGGLEFFANKPNKVCQVRSPEADDLRPSVHDQQVIPSSGHAPHQTRGKGKGNRADQRESRSPLAVGWSDRTHAAEVSSHANAAEFDMSDHEHEVTDLMPSEQFSVTVCCMDFMPVRIKVEVGTTVGQLSQAEAGISLLVQPIVVTTLTGIPLPLQGLLTPEAWYVIANGAVHSTPKCTAVHAEKSIVVTTPHRSRFHALLCQGPLVATDEMDYYATLVRNQGNHASPPIVLDSFDDPSQLIATWVLQCMHEYEECQDRKECIVPILFQSHWSPIAFNVKHGRFQLHVPQDLACRVQGLVTDACGDCGILIEPFMLPTSFAADCGFQTVNWMFAYTIGTSNPKPVTPAQADQWRTPFAHSIIDQDSVPAGGLRLGGVVQPDQILLQSLLKQHGVGQDRLASCAAHLISQLGPDAIAKALASPHAWRDLKTLASQVVPPIRIVLAAELDAAVKARLSQDKPIGTKATKTPRSPATRDRSRLSSRQLTKSSSLMPSSCNRMARSCPLSRFTKLRRMPKGLRCATSMM